jgi:uncharacterized lipoprotein YehR (DUF1307 family)
MANFRKIICLILTLMMIFTFVACGDDETSSSESSSQSESVSESVTDTETNSEESSETETSTGDDFREGANMNSELGEGYTPAYPPDYIKK